MLKLSLVLVALFSVGCHGVSTSFGKCSKGPVIPDFDVTKYIGKWYEIEKVPAPFTGDLKCSAATYALKDSKTISVDNQGFYVSDNSPSGIQGEASIIDLAKPNQLRLKFPNIPAGTYNVIKTDYESYALVYSCIQVIPYLVKSELIYMLSRERDLKEEVRADLRQFLTDNKIKAVKDLTTTDQVNC